MRSNKSKKLAIWLVGITTILTTYSIFKELEGVAVAIWSTGIPTAVALYANKQYQDRKWGELTNNNKQDSNAENVS